MVGPVGFEPTSSHAPGANLRPCSTTASWDYGPPMPGSNVGDVRPQHEGRVVSTLIKLKETVEGISVESTTNYIEGFNLRYWSGDSLLSRVEVVDVTVDPSRYEVYLYRCLSPIPFRRYRRRREYLKAAIPKGLHKKVLLLEGRAVGQIEYAPYEASGYPIVGEDLVVMNCIWVLRRAKGHGFGKLLIKEMTEGEEDASSFATIGLEGHWSPWLKREHMELLGFKPIDSITVTHRTKHPGEVFRVYLMWLKKKRTAEPPRWDVRKLLEGVTFCLAYPLYHPETLKDRNLLQEHDIKRGETRPSNAY